MRAYIEYARKSFIGSMVYKIDYIAGMINTILQIFIFWCLYKIIYGNSAEFDGITLAMVMTSFILSLGLSNTFYLNDSYLQRKIYDGTIANELLKPVSFKGRLLAEDIGNILSRLLTNFLPELVITALTIGIMAPASIFALLLFLTSTVLGFFVLWQLSFIIQVLAFWLVNIWSISTIKNVFVNILSGTMLPLWFMPEAVFNLIKYTPFDSIYFTPVRLYFGQILGSDIVYNFLRQIFWILLLYAIGEILWRAGQRKLVIQGG
ncbi:MAG: ABC-2 family transporter protein [Clostridiaceae bacterium]